MKDKSSKESNENSKDLKQLKALFLQDGRLLIKDLDKSLLENKEVMKYFLSWKSQWKDLPNYFPEKFKDDEEIVSMLVKHYGLFLEYASERLRGSKEIVELAVENNAYAIKYAKEELHRDEEIISKLLERNVLASRHLKGDFWSNKKHVLKVVSKYGDYLEYAKKFYGNKEVVMAAVKENWFSIRFASSKIKDDEEMMLYALREHDDAFEFASSRLKKRVVEILEEKSHLGWHRETVLEFLVKERLALKEKRILSKELGDLSNRKAKRRGVLKDDLVEFQDFTPQEIEREQERTVIKKRMRI